MFPGPKHDFVRVKGFLAMPPCQIVGIITGLGPGALMGRIHQSWIPSDPGSVIVAKRVGPGSVAQVLKCLLHSRDGIPDVDLVGPAR